MGLWGALKSVAKGVASRLLPALAQSGLDEYRKKNPKSGWIVDAVESTLGSYEQEAGFKQLTPEAKVERVAKQIRKDFPGTDLETAREISRLAVSKKIQSPDKKGA